MVGERAPALLALLGLRPPMPPIPMALSSPYPRLTLLPRKPPPLAPTTLPPEGRKHQSVQGGASVQKSGTMYTYHGEWCHILQGFFL